MCIDTSCTLLIVGRIGSGRGDGFIGSMIGVVSGDNRSGDRQLDRDLKWTVDPCDENLNSDGVRSCPFC